MKEKPKKSVRMWVARDKNNKLYVYRNKPMLSISNELFPSRVVLRLI